jgi:hypothetical protein
LKGFIAAVHDAGGAAGIAADAWLPAAARQDAEVGAKPA